MKNGRFIQLKTPFEKDMGNIPYEEYPRPCLQRDSYICLNGKWELLDNGVSKGFVNVPFAPQSRLSGLDGYEDFDLESFECKRSFTLPDGFVKDRIFLHFGACDQIADVYVNGKRAGGNIGGYLPFSFDITDLCRNGENELSVLITDKLDTDIPYGKQSKKRGGMWYTPISGIWQTVWLESVPENYIQGIKAQVGIDQATLTVSGAAGKKELIFDDENAELNCEFDGESVTVRPKEVHLWSPEDPYLYRFTLKTENDSVRSYFALRTVGAEVINGYPRMLLNGKPYFFNGLLDQGYYSDGIYLPATPEGFKFDILQLKKLGFKMLRKHIKIEPQLFYYYCDVYGMAVFQDMVNSGKYNFVIDTALPTVFLKKGIHHSASAKRKDLFEKMMKKTTELLYNHPSVVYYTIFNEGWGQFGEKRMYSLAKALDDSRIWDTTSGWFKTNCSDVESDHVYFKPVKYKEKPAKLPRVLSEFGGYSYIVPEHTYNPDNNYGYKTYRSADELTDGLCALYENEVVTAVKRGLCGAVLTQVSDVEDETNGILTYDRQVVKPDPERLKKANDAVFKAFEDCTKQS